MDLKCYRITKVLLPAVRASVSEAMKKRYDYRQEKIAEELGIVQVAVSKYLNKRYSDEVRRVKKYIDSKRLSEPIVHDILNNEKHEKIDNAIDSLCMNLAKLNL